MKKYDIKKEYPQLYRAMTKKISSLVVPKLKYIAIDGIGNPTVPEFRNKSKLLFLINKSLKEYYQKQEISFSGAKLEGLWDTYDNSHFDVTRKKMIKYTLMMLQPPILTEEILEEIKMELLLKTGDYFTLDVYLKEFEEGECIQMLHIGPYNTEINSTKQIMEYITVANLKLSGLHHEIYLNKPERVAPENLKTIVRYPVEEDLI
ncbi:GyrI-like domain-containing protein [Thomasclavelia saccharogumia]|uniref:GyrI-like domain-containing protein n=1 Tax=Thomasclavelia saccharogumia TaxID=341225 RepID=UPI0004797BC7|nr:GyrI-like domain-containing protein [Thomasclavelia saccharogumia]